MNASNFIEPVKAFVESYFAKQTKKLQYHNITHTQKVAAAVQAISEEANLEDSEKEIVVIAAWFHDIGYFEGSLGHEMRSVEIATKQLNLLNFDTDKIEQVGACIMATKMPQQPKNKLQQIICDADLSNLGSTYFKEATAALRLEMNERDEKNVCTDENWLKNEIAFLEQTEYHTSEARALFGKQKQLNLTELKKELDMQNRQTEQSTNGESKKEKKEKKEKKKHKTILSPEALAKIKQEIKQELKEEKKKDKKKEEYGRGVETFYRITLRNQISLSAIADRKASTLLSVNSIILSIILSVMVPRVEAFSQLIIPVIIMVLTSVTTIIFAVLATTPKVTEGTTDRQTILNKKSNLAFFGNFHKMPLDDYLWGTKEMFKDSEFLYDSLSRDIYFLGVVLAKKYRFLRFAYTFFVGGFILVSVVFAKFKHLI